MQCTMTDHDTSEEHERLVDVGAALPADAQAAKLMQPRHAPFYHPTGLAQAAAMRRAAFGQFWNDAPGAQRVTVRIGVVPTISLHPVRTKPWMTEPAGNRG